MANNNKGGRMIVYDTAKTTGAMAEAMGIAKKKDKQLKKPANTTNAATANTATNTTTNTTNINNNNNNKRFVAKKIKKELTVEEKREKAVKTTLDALEAMMVEAGDEFTKMKGRNYRVRTGVLDHYGGEVIIRVYQDDNDAPDIITIFDDDGVFNDFVAEHDNEREVWDEIQKFCLRKQFFSLRGIHSNVNGNPECYLQIKGKVEDYVKMKWQLLDTLKMIYDEDKELREACGL